MKPNLEEIKTRLEETLAKETKESMLSFLYTGKITHVEQSVHEEVLNRIKLPVKLRVSIEMRLKCLIEEGVKDVEQMAKILTEDVLKTIEEHIEMKQDPKV